MKLQVLKNVPQWEAETPNLLEHERRQLAQRIGEALYDEGYIKIEESEGIVPGFNCRNFPDPCEKSIIIKMTFDFIARNDDTITGRNGAYVNHGHWKQIGNEYKCSLCGSDAGLNYYREHRMTTKFCPNCGAKMRGDTHEKNTDTV